MRRLLNNLTLLRKWLVVFSLWVSSSENAGERQQDQPPQRPPQRDLKLRIGKIALGFAQMKTQVLQKGRALLRRQRLSSFGQRLRRRQVERLEIVRSRLSRTRRSAHAIAAHRPIVPMLRQQGRYGRLTSAEQ
jgi:hypothetical protein